MLPDTYEKDLFAAIKAGVNITTSILSDDKSVEVVDSEITVLP